MIENCKIESALKSKNKKKCHSERSEESSINATSGFFIPLRSIQNDLFRVDSIFKIKKELYLELF